MEENNQNSKMAIPGAILLGAVIVAGAVIYSSGGFKAPLGSGGSGTGAVVNGAGGAPPTIPQGSKATENMKPVTRDDHIQGSISDPVKIVEFSDLECPFCKRFHATMQRVSDEYAGKVAWVYRHFPLDSLHSKARKEAEATECANELGGNDKFWEYTNRLMEITPSNNRLDSSELPRIAEHVGLDKQKFQECLDSGRYRDHIEQDLQDAISSGGTGTPYSVLIAPNGEKFVISGAQPYESIKQTIEAALNLN